MKRKPKITIITVVYNNVSCIEAAVRSVLAQDSDNFEYIVVDGGSTDGTLEKLESERKIHKLIHGPDRGMYDALNKGIRAATGEVIGILHSDDVFASPSIISTVSKCFAERNPDMLFGDIVFVNNHDRITRYYCGQTFQPSQFAMGMMPPHTSFYARRELFDRFGDYDLRWKIASDFDLMMRFMLIHHVKYEYLPLVMVKMRTGGASTRGWRSNLQINQEIRESCRVNGVKTNYIKIYSKYFIKSMQLFQRPARPF